MCSVRPTLYWAALTPSCLPSGIGHHLARLKSAGELDVEAAQAAMQAAGFTCAAGAAQATRGCWQGPMGRRRCCSCRKPLTAGDAQAVAVGTRKCTAYGRQVARQLASDLARRGFCIVSGLAGDRRRGASGSVMATMP